MPTIWRQVFLQQHFDARVAEVRAFLRRIDVPLLLLSSDHEVVDQVLEQLGNAGGGGR